LVTSYSGRYIRYGIREHAMAAISNGLFAFGGFRPFCATFLNFLTYAWGAVRLSALSRFGVLYIATHDSIELGEDGPTHQPIETIALVRATPNILLVRPADAIETAAAYVIWLKNRSRPTVIALCRSSVPTVTGTCHEGVLRGGYIVSDWDETVEPAKRIILAASGTELHVCSKAIETISKAGASVRLVSMTCWELFAEMPQEYRHSVIPPRETHNSLCSGSLYVEAASSFGWEKYFSNHIGMYSFGASGPGDQVLKNFGFSPGNVAKKAMEIITANSSLEM